MKKDGLVECLKDSGIFLLIALVFMVSLSSIFFLFGIEISKFHLSWSLIMSSIPFYLLNRKKILSSLIISICLAFFVLLLSIGVNSMYLDLSWDGNTYHKDAVGLLKNGWNPIYEEYIETYEKLGNRDMNYIGDKIDKTHGFWQTYYAKGTWLIGSSIYSFTDDIETGKAYNLLVTYISFVLLLSLLYKFGCSFLISILISFVFAFNPIIIAQMFTYYNDGFLGNLLMLLIFYMMIFVMENQNISKKELYFCICSILILLINTKFTGFGYAGIFCLFFYLFYLYKKYKQNCFKDIIKPTIIFAVTVIFSVFIVGFSPYIKNVLENKPIFYPLMGKEKEDIVTYNQPIEFNNENNVCKFTKSLFSRTKNINKRSNLKLELKIPFTVNIDELKELHKPDLRIAGFGVLFSGILIVSVAILSWCLFSNLIKKIEVKVLIAIPLFVTTMLIIFISESWWARYSPYLYLLPILALILISFYKSKFKYLFFSILFIPMLLNIGFFFGCNIVANFEQSNEIIKRLENLKNKEIKVIDTWNEFVGLFYNLEDRKIDFVISTKNEEGSKDLYKWVKYVEMEE